MTRNYLKELRVVVLAGIVVIVLFSVLDLVTIASGSPILTTLQISSTDQPGMLSLPEGVTAAPLSGIEIEITRPTAVQRLLYGFTMLPTSMILLIALGLLSRVIQRAQRTNPFTTETVGSLRLIGATVLLGVMAAVVEFGAQMALNATVTEHQFGASIQWPYVWILILGGFVCFAVAEMIQRGCALRDELESVI